MQTTFDFSSLFENLEFLQKGTEQINLKDALNKQVIGLYFSAHWCPPCRGFTPNLVAKYNDLKAQNQSFEIIFLSSDRTEAQFNDYYNEMPWLSVPYAQRQVKENLAKKFQCDGIPYLVFLNGQTGETISLEGRELIEQYGVDAFPFTKDAIINIQEKKNQQVTQIFKDWSIFGEAVDKEKLRSTEAIAVFVGDAQGIAGVHVYEKLLQAYNKLKMRLSVVYVPNYDNVDDEDFEKEFQEQMPPEWFKLDKDSQCIKELKKVLSQIPDPYTLILSNDGTIILNDEASRYIYENKEKNFPWTKESIQQAEKQKQSQLDEFNSKIKDLGFLNTANLINQNKEQQSVQALNECELVGIYFSAHWCPPCRQFTPIFAEVYKKLKLANKNVQVIFISSDQDQQQFESYFEEMPWIALDYKDRELKNLLSEAFQVNGIPKLIWIDPKTGKVDHNGRANITAGSDYFPWTPELMKKFEDQKVEQKLKQQAEIQEQQEKVIQGFKNAKTVIVKNRIGLGTVMPDYTLKFNSFNTFEADIQLKIGKFYYEVEVIDKGAYPQLGWFTEGFQAPRENPLGEGVGDDEYSFGFDGHRKLKWYDGQNPFGSEWNNGDILGFAVDIQEKIFSLSVNGSFESPNGVAFKSDDIKQPLPWVTPAFTCQQGEYKVNFGDRPFKFKPEGDYLSVHQAL